MSISDTLTQLEKCHYPFKRYPKTPCETILFPGCSFPSQFPRTMDALAELCRNRGIGIAYDCCGEPLAGFGKGADGRRVTDGVAKRLHGLGCKRVVTACPNCQAHFKANLDIPVISVFDFFEEEGISQKGKFEQGVLFTPCPDMRDGAMREQIRKAYDLGCVTDLRGVGCCGLKSTIASKGPQAVAACTERVLEGAGEQRIYTYCASCLGQFARFGHSDCTHIVSTVLGIDEEPDAGRALLNRAKRKFDRHVNPTGGQVR